MNKRLCWMVLMVILMAGCKDSAQVRSALGTYSYKTSGVLQIDTTLSVAFTERGAMEVISLKNADSILVTFNELSGGVSATHGSIKGDEIVLNPYSRLLTQPISLDPIEIVVSGSGHVYDGSIVMQLQYAGVTASGLTLSARDVQLIAKKN